MPECTIWLQARDGLVRSWGVGDPVLTAAEVQARIALTGPRQDPIVVAAFGSGATRTGALAVRLGRDPDQEESLLVAAVANIFASELAHARKSRRLEAEVGARSAETERQRVFIERIIDSLPLGLYVIDREFRIQAWNRKRETGMQGISREEAIGRTIFEILHRQSPEMLRREFEEVFSTGRIQEYEMESHAIGESRVYRVSKIPMRLDDSGVTHIITIGEDITEWKGSQRQLAQTEKMAAIGQLAAGVMHEINNPLATIAACADGLGFKLGDAKQAGGAIPADVEEYLQIIGNEVARCKKIVDGLLDFSRPKRSLKEPVLLNDVVERTLLLLKHHERFRNLVVRTELDPQLGLVPKASSEQLVQVLMALLLNAMDAVGDRGEISVRTRRGASAAAGAIVEVIDKGQGIARSELSKLFEPFYTTKPPGRGTGLGLSICYGIVHEHGGRIEVDSTLGLGSTFRVLLPTAEPA